MGRRKIEIKPIKDDRNRSVTFLKRKGGLFKKAHELSVLCNVDVAVVIFGTNRKLYEYSSGNIDDTLSRRHYYGPPHERKGPADFADKDGASDDEDEAMGVSGPEDRGNTPQPPSTIPQPQMHHMRHGSNTSNAPPMQNGMYGQQHRISTPQPQQYPSRPTSVTSHRRVSSNLVPQDHPHPQASQGYGYGHLQNPNYYAQARAGMQAYSNQSTPLMPAQQLQHVNQHSQTYPIPPQNQMQQLYLQEQRRQSVPPNFGVQQDRSQSIPAIHHSPPQLSKPFQSPPMPGSPQQAPAPPPSRNYSQYDGGYNSQGSGQQWPGHHPGNQSFSHNTRAASFDNASVNRGRASSAEPRPPFAPPGNIQRARSPLAQADRFESAQPSPPFQQSQASRVNSVASDTKRPRLAIQIPSDASPEDNTVISSNQSTTPEQQHSSSAASNTNSTPSHPRTQTHTNSTTSTSARSQRGSVVLPPPSPSAPRSEDANPLSAGATGPPNPFARPPPPHAQQRSHPQPHALNTNFSAPISNLAPGQNPGQNAADTPTPVSALPSRFMSNDLLPSPSTFFNNDWNASGGGLWSAGGMSAGGMNGLGSPSGLFQPTPVRESSGVQWPASKGDEKMEVDADVKPEMAGGGGADEAAAAQEHEARMKRKVISPTEGSDERTKRGNWAAER